MDKCEKEFFSRRNGWIPINNSTLWGMVLFTGTTSNKTQIIKICKHFECRPFCFSDAILAGLWGGKNYENMTTMFKVKTALYSVHPSTNKYLDQVEKNISQSDCFKKKKIWLFFFLYKFVQSNNNNSYLTSMQHTSAKNLYKFWYNDKMSFLNTKYNILFSEFPDCSQIESVAINKVNINKEEIIITEILTFESFRIFEKSCAELNFIQQLFQL